MKKQFGSKTLPVSVTACPRKRQCLKIDDVLFILRLPSTKDELMIGTLCTLLAGSRLHLLLTKPEALYDGRKCLEEGESNQTDWKLLLCGQYVVQELNINHSNLGSKRMVSKKAKTS